MAPLPPGIGCLVSTGWVESDDSNDDDAAKSLTAYRMGGPLHAARCTLLAARCGLRDPAMQGVSTLQPRGTRPHFVTWQVVGPVGSAALRSGQRAAGSGLSAYRFGSLIVKSIEADQRRHSRQPQLSWLWEACVNAARYEDKDGEISWPSWAATARSSFGPMDQSFVRTQHY
ncbi:uncharacterized protein UV8b_03475 [Ustilaginoidea virens]|uniref:Uncharacterized protein n=1 Tax=Ustilaginoidea virens TaxID=1159556 RepID=A0A8E5HPE7_USTVR|nr:uncharacterized protein UV8b_03475 [Ustilaginoidea virens]QUC19234.1 hypothetical protein UV8b_03475 [Ustilaginoidea virens]